jgi:hypothetical protein
VGGVITGSSTSVTGTTTAASVVGGVMTGTSVSASGNVTGGNIHTVGVVSATGNITGNYFFGNGSQLTGISAGGGGIEWTTSATAPVGPNPGDFWYDTDDDKTYQYVNDGVGNAWIDQSAPTSFGNLTVGNILNGGANGSGNIGSATGYFNTTFSTNGTFVNLLGNGAALTAINASNISSGTLAQARLANAAVTLGSTALTLGATVTTVAGLSSVTSTTFVGALTGAATTAGTVTTAAQPNITSVGTMSVATITTLTTAGITKSGTNGAGNIGQSDNAFNTVFAKATSAQYADLAENYLADCCYEPGTVVIFGGNAEVSVSSVSHDPRVAGVVSTNPSYLMNATLIGPTVSAVALTGRVPCWVQGPVSKGDRIVNAGTGIGGRLDRSAYEPGCIVGKSLEDIVDDSTRLIEVVIGRF